MLQLETPPLGTPYQKQRTLLSGVPFEVYWAFNTRTESWTISLSAIGDAEEEPTPVLNGAKLFIGYDLLRRCRHEKRPPGELYVISADGTRLHPGRDDLGVRCNVIYLEPGELSG
jgi:hypothetical protein